MVKGIETSDTNLPDTPIQEKTFSSRALSPKSRIEGNAFVTTDGSGAATYDVTHNLGYAPVHMFFFKPGNTNAVLHPGLFPWIDIEKNNTWGIMDNFTLTVLADAIKCRVRIQGLNNTRYDFKWFIFEERAKT